MSKKTESLVKEGYSRAKAKIMLRKQNSGICPYCNKKIGKKGSGQATHFESCTKKPGNK